MYWLGFVALVLVMAFVPPPLPVTALTASLRTSLLFLSCALRTIHISFLQRPTARGL